MVEAERDVPRDKRFWLLLETLGGAYLQGPETKWEVVGADVKDLARAGLLRREGDQSYRVTPEGRDAYAEWQLAQGAPMERVEQQARRLLDSDSFRSAYGGAYRLWAEAEELLWREDSEAELTTIGHKAREAMQAFATEVVARYEPPDIDPDPAHVNRRLGALIAAQLPALGEARGELLKALGDYSEATIDVIQRQEHGKHKRGSALTWNDGRRVVQHVAMVMFEFASTLDEVKRGD
jgi:hypothetical protein